MGLYANGGLRDSFLYRILCPLLPGCPPLCAVRWKLRLGSPPHKQSSGHGVGPETPITPMRSRSSESSSGQNENPIRLFVVEDHSGLREMLCMYCQMQADMELCGYAASGEEALDAMETCGPTLVLVDLALPGMSGIELIAEIHHRFPQVDCLILSGHKEPAFARQARDAGAHGYILKGNPDTIASAIRRTAAGELCFDPELQVE